MGNQCSSKSSCIAKEPKSIMRQNDVPKDEVGPTLLVSSPDIKLSDACSVRSICIQNAFYSSPAACRTQQYCQSPDDISVDWLGDALDAEVLSFATIVCGQGQMGVTVIVKDIEYGPSTVGRPASVAIKFHTQTEAALPLVRSLNTYSRELFFYTSFAQEVPLNAPKVLGVWTDANGADLANGAPVEAFNLIMENLSEAWDGFDVATNPPTTEEFQDIVLAAQAVHVKFWKSPLITQKPFSETGAELDFYAKLEPLRPMIKQAWPAVRDMMPQLAGWADSTWPAQYAELIDFVDGFLVQSPELYDELSDEVERIQRSRPMTLVHGDLNAGNVWKNKTNPAELLFADWQLLKMAPIGFDFGTMLVIMPGGPDGEAITGLMRAYHSKLPSEIQKEYPYSMLRDDFRCQVVGLMLSVAIVMGGQLDPDSMEASKFEFTWKSFWPAVFERFLQLYQSEDIKGFSQKLLDGTVH